MEFLRLVMALFQRAPLMALFQRALKMALFQLALWMAPFQQAHQLPLSIELASLQLSIEITVSTLFAVLAALRQATPFPALLCLKRQYLWSDSHL